MAIAVTDVSPETTGGTASADKFVGGAGNDRLGGGAGADTLLGGTGNDIINGGLGRNTLTGGAGRDVFVFDSKPDNSAITDFAVKDDSIWVDNAIFKALGKGGSASKPLKLASKFFTVGTKASERDDHLIYHKKTGVLFYDDDGSGSHAQIAVATLKRGLDLKAEDFLVI